MCDKPILKHHFIPDTFEVANDYYTFCGDMETKCFLSSEIATTTGEKVFVDARLDLENNQIDAQFGLLNENGFAGLNSDWTCSLNIAYCPVCGRKLEEQ